MTDVKYVRTVIETPKTKKLHRTSSSRLLADKFQKWIFVKITETSTAQRHVDGSTLRGQIDFQVQGCAIL